MFMFLLIPLFLIFGSLLAIALVIWRKLPYLKKLPVDTPPSDSGFLSEWFPEANHYYKKIDLSAYRDYWLKELEKFLRRLRLVSLKLDRLTNSLINKTKTRTNGAKPKEGGRADDLSFGTAGENVIQNKEAANNYRRQEQLLILEIAKNPKNPELYKKLAEIYISAKNFSDARESLETALELSPQDEKIKEKLEMVKKTMPT